MNKIACLFFTAVMALAMTTCAVAGHRAVVRGGLQPPGLPCAYAWPYSAQGFQLPVRAPRCEARTHDDFIRRGFNATVYIHTDYLGRLPEPLTEIGGTGVLVDADGTVLTARHVIREARDIFVEFRELAADAASYRLTHIIKMRVADDNAETDSALLVPLESVHAGALPSPMPVCRMAAYPVTRRLWHYGLLTAWSAATVISPHELITTATGTKAVFAASSLVYWGDSGGPVMDHHGRLVGLVSAMKAFPFPRFYGVPIADVLAVLKYRGATVACD